ncbi:efflux RND transporter periplasmic adaptor subunit [Endozoicomonas sp.]|uniref:efflux RND transporter periplasmic adaptor subunit n=1 Tax=Endozoicomonas sp. TaxID=1892382 RepID=UPI0028854A10|nr:efflux RND transporter periplasmic adaptor subunit [Endozoicomonas sp.]
MKFSKVLIISLVLVGLALAGYRIQGSGDSAAVVYEAPPIRVDVLQVMPGELSAWAFAEGTVEALQKAFLNFEQSGKVVHIGSLADGSPLREGVRVFGPNDDVRLGQLLARIDNRENTSEVVALEARLQSARERRKEAESGVHMAQNDKKQAEKDFARIEAIYQKGVVSRDEYDRYRTGMLNAQIGVEAAESSLQAAISEEKGVAADLNRATVNLEKTSLFAPFDGVITAMNVLQDNYYYPPAGISTNREREAASAIVVVDDSQYEIRLEVSEAEARLIKEGQLVYLAQDDRVLYDSVNSGFDQPGAESSIVKGRVWSVSPSLSLQRRSRLVKVRTHGDAQAIQDGMFVRAWIATEQKTDVLTLPWQAISFRDGMPYVFVVKPENRVELRWLSIGIQGLLSLEVVSGLQDGDRVVVRGQHLLANDSSVAVINERQPGDNE